MIRYKISNKEIKAIKEFDKAAKDCFPSYYVNFKGEAFAPRKVYKDGNRLSFIRDVQGYLDFLFQIFELGQDKVIELYHPIIIKSTAKLSAVDFIVLKHNKIYLELNEIKEKDKKGIEEYLTFKGNVIYAHIGNVRQIDERIQKIYNVSYPLIDEIHWLDDETISRIINKEIVMLEHNEHRLLVGKPMFPGINKNTKVGISFTSYPDPENDELFVANLVLFKEQIYRCHKYIGIRMFN